MSKSLNIDVASYGTAAAVFFIAYVILELPSNLILSRVGARVWLSRIAITWGIVTILSGFVWDTTSLYISRIALGAAEAGLFPGLLLFLSYWFLQENRGRALATMVFAQPVALILGSVTAGLILDYGHWLGLEPWQWLFILQGAPAVLVGIYILLFLADRPGKAHWLTPVESGWLESRIKTENSAVLSDDIEGAHHLGGILRAFRTPRVILLSAVAFLSSIGNYGMAFFLPQIVQQMNPTYSAANIGFVGALPYICAGIAMLVVGRISDRLTNRRGIVIACLAIGVVGLVASMAFRHAPVPGLISLCILAIGIVSYSPPMWAFITELLSTSQRVVVLPIMTSIASFAGFVAPILIGKLAANGNVAFGLIVPAICLAFAVVLLALVRTRISDDAEMDVEARGVASPAAARSSTPGGE
jgi:ACS family tartrate transporter-like MFS transporter